jgi:hypothetical protein
MLAWSQLYATIATVAATLMGLLFVAVSITNTKLTVDVRDGTRHLAEQAFRSYSTALFISLVALYPDVSLVTFGRIALAITASSALFALVRLYAAIRSLANGTTSRVPGISTRMLSAVVGYGLLIFAEGEMGFFALEARGTLASGALVLLSAAALTSWNLLLGLSKA